MKEYNGFTEAQRAKAGRWLKKQIEAGLVKPPKICCACGQTQGVIDYHAEDYNEPFGPHIYQYPMCYLCHMLLHCRSRKAQWERYLKLLRDGFNARAMFGRHWDGVKRFLEGGELHGTYGDRRPVLIFDTMFLNPPKPRPAPPEPQAPVQASLF